MLRFARIGIIGLWLVMLGWLVHTEWAPPWLASHVRGYRGLMTRGPLLADQWLLVRVGAQPIGFSHTLINTAPEKGADGVTMENRTTLHLHLLGQPQTVNTRTEVQLDGAYRLQHIRLAVHASPYRVDIAARRRGGGETFDVTLETPAGRTELTIELPDDVVLYSPVTDALIGALKPGQTLRLKTFDLLSLSPGTVTVTAQGAETIAWGGEEVTAMRLETNYRGMTLTSWVANDGSLLRQETPFGWVFERTEARVALAAARQAAGQPVDLLAGVAVPVTGLLANPRATDRIRLRLEGVADLADWIPQSARQRVVSATHAGVVLELRRAARSAPGAATAPDDLARWLAPSPFIQSDHPALREKARAITAGTDSPLAAAEAIHDWVHEMIRKAPSAGLPSALDVLAELSGDCNEHTVLFVALARAAGLPARLVAGLAYHEGHFYYHAWPEVYLEGWLEMDPTFGQRRADATHLALAHGDLDAQLGIAPILGRARIHLLETEPGAVPHD